MKLQKLIFMMILSQLSVACLATPYEPTKSPPARKGVAPPRSSPTDSAAKPICQYQLKNEHSLEEIAHTAALMRSECDLTAQQIVEIAKQNFN